MMQRYLAMGFIWAGGAIFAQTTVEPLSAIDWLSQSVQVPVVASQVAPHAISEPPIANSAATPTITVTPLDAPSPDPIGLLSPEVTGLPQSLWAASDQDTVVTLVRAERFDSLPAIQEFMVILMLAEADAPRDASTDGALFLSRVDKLLDYGAIEPARALLEQADPEEPSLFRRWFDIALLTGSEDAACEAMQSNPQLAPTFSARIFCLARSGDWNTAALTLNTHRVLGDVSEEDEALLSRFLDPELYEGEGKLPNPSRISPLVFRMREAIGEGLTTQNLPRAFAHADLRDTVGWKSQLEAAERLARYGAVSDNVLAGFYADHTPSASGGVWDRVEAVQKFAVALKTRDPGAISASLPAAWIAARASKTEIPFARLFAEDLQCLPLTDEASDVAFVVGLLSPSYESFALAASDGRDPFLVAVARGFADEATATTTLSRAIRDGFGETQAPAVLAALLDEGKLGEALLRNIALFDAGMSGDSRAISESLALFRLVGLEDVARRAALQLLLLERAS